MDHFTKFDRLGDALRAAGVNCNHVSLGWSHHDNGREFFTVYLHGDRKAHQGIGDTASKALANAIAMQDEYDRAKKIAAVESACEMEQAA